MKKLLIAAALLVAALTSCDKTVNVDKAADAMKKKVLASANTVNPAKWAGQCWYVSAEGNDEADGLSPETAIKSLAKLKTLDIKEGDAVLFRRGDTWRGTTDSKHLVRSRNGVTYSAYGKGPKPCICGSPFNGAEYGTWTLTEVPDVYVYSEEFTGDVGTIVLDEKDAAFKVVIRNMPEGDCHPDTYEPFTSWKDLTRDLDFYQQDNLIYLCSKEGAPAERFKDMEFNVHGHGFSGADNLTVDNFCIKNIGSHGIGSGTTKGLAVTNCEIGWIGGSLQPGAYSKSRRMLTRYGNGVEIYGGCDNYLIQNCWVYQCYDAGITHQYSTSEDRDIIMKNVLYKENLIEDCVYSIEYFLPGSKVEGYTHNMENILFQGNICRRAGYGWGKQRPDKNTPSHIKSWNNDNPAVNFLIKDNIFEYCTHEFFNITAADPAWMPVLENNTCIE